MRLLPPGEGLPRLEEAGSYVWISTDATLTRISGISWGDYEYLVENPVVLGRPFLRHDADDLHIGVCELVDAIVAVLARHSRNNWVRRIILRADNINAPNWFESGKAKEGAICRILRVLLQWCIDYYVEVTPRYIRSGHNMSADGLTRWIPEDVSEWAAVHGMTRTSAPEIWPRLAIQMIS